MHQSCYFWKKIQPWCGACSLTSVGDFNSALQNAGKYIIASSITGFKTMFSQSLTVTGNESIEVKPIQLQEKEELLSDIRIVAKKPLYEQKMDRMVINVSSSITNAGSTVMEVLLRSPGVILNKQSGTLSMNGKDGVMVMLNGKLNRMPMDAMVQLLSGMNSSNIEKIELITTPPANMDAEGNAGFINIVLKKNVQEGFNGTFSLTAGYGLNGGPIYGAGLNFNFRKGKWNLYGDYSFNHEEPNSQMLTERIQTIQGSTIQTMVDGNRDDFRNNQTGRLGIDYELGPKTEAGMLVSGFRNFYGMDAVNKSTQSINGVVDSVRIIQQNEDHPLDNLSLNFYITQKIGKTGKLSLNLDYNDYNNDNVIIYFTEHYKGNGQFLSQDSMRSSMYTPISIKVATLDYSQKIAKNTEMETGFKITQSVFDNTVLIERMIGGNWYKYPEYSNYNHLVESILAGYVSVNMLFSEKTSAKIGLRYEHTHTNLDTEVKKDTVNRLYGNLFPTVYVSHALNQDHSLNASYSRRISRPSFNDMAPFVYFIDQTTFMTGNPTLLPALSDAIKLTYNYKQLSFFTEYTYINNPIMNFVSTFDTTQNKQVIASENWDRKNILSMGLNFPLKVNSWWTMQNSFTAQWHQTYQGKEESSFKVTGNALMLNTTQTFQLPKDYSIEFTAQYMSGMLFSIYNIDPMFITNLGLQKKFGANGGNLTLNILNLTGPPHYKTSIYYPAEKITNSMDLKFETTVIKATYTKKFGNQKVKEIKNRNTGSEEEKGRVNKN